MSDPNIITQRQIQALEETQERLRKADVPALYLPWSQRALNPFPLASSGGVWGDQAQPWASNLIAWYNTITVITTNNGTNFWTVALKDAAGVTLASFTTAAFTVNVSTKATAITSFTQPSSSNPFVSIIATATLSPGAIFIFPALALLRTGN